MDEIPPDLLDGVTPARAGEVRAWWMSLSDADRGEVTTLWDERWDSCFFTPRRDDVGGLHWESGPSVIGGHFVPKDDAAGWAEWYSECFDYLICNQDMVYFPPPVMRTFHIGCAKHGITPAALAAGQVPSDFQCPLGSRDCPVHELAGRTPHMAGKAMESSLVASGNTSNPSLLVLREKGYELWLEPGENGTL